MMTIKEKIDAYVLAQGNQVGAGAELASLLKEIVDSIPGAYTLPAASAQTLGGIKVGENLSIDEQGVLSASGGGGGALIVEGIVNEDKDFVPNAGQSSHEDAVEAFSNGTLVLLDVEDEDSETHILYHVTSLDLDAGSLIAGSVTW